MGAAGFVSEAHDLVSLQRKMTRGVNQCLTINQRPVDGRATLVMARSSAQHCWTPARPLNVRARPTREMFLDPRRRGRRARRGPTRSADEAGANAIRSEERTAQPRCDLRSEPLSRAATRPIWIEDAIDGYGCVKRR